MAHDTSSYLAGFMTYPDVVLRVESVLLQGAVFGVLRHDLIVVDAVVHAPHDVVKGVPEQPREALGFQH